MTNEQTPNSEEKHFNKDDARQATHTFGLRVLVISMVLIVTGFILAYLAVVAFDSPQSAMSSDTAPAAESQVAPSTEQTPAGIEVPAQ